MFGWVPLFLQLLPSGLWFFCISLGNFMEQISWQTWLICMISLHVRDRIFLPFSSLWCYSQARDLWEPSTQLRFWSFPPHGYHSCIWTSPMTRLRKYLNCTQGCGTHTKTDFELIGWRSAQSFRCQLVPREHRTTYRSNKSAQRLALGVTNWHFSRSFHFNFIALTLVVIV